MDEMLQLFPIREGVVGSITQKVIKFLDQSNQEKDWLEDVCELDS